MKTNVLMQSKDRELFGVVISQQTKDNYLSISDLQKAYEKARWKYGWSEQNITSLMQSKTFQERLFYILEEKGVIKVDISTFIEMCKKEGIAKVLKGLEVYKTTGARETKKVMCDPYIWVLIALELNPMIYAKVIMWLTDTLIFDRIEAGDEYRPMNATIKKYIDNPDYPLIARKINEKVFGTHVRGMRDIASAAELKKISEIEKHIMRMLDRGYIKTQDQILLEISEFTK